MNKTKKLYFQILKKVPKEKMNPVKNYWYEINSKFKIVFNFRNLNSLLLLLLLLLLFTFIFYFLFVFLFYLFLFYIFYFTSKSDKTVSMNFKQIAFGCFKIVTFCFSISFGSICVFVFMFVDFCLCLF